MNISMGCERKSKREIESERERERAKERERRIETDDFVNILIGCEIEIERKRLR